MLREILVQRHPRHGDTGRITFRFGEPPPPSFTILPKKGGIVKDHPTVPFLWIPFLDSHTLLGEAPITRDLLVQATPVRYRRGYEKHIVREETEPGVPNPLLHFCLLHTPRYTSKILGEPEKPHLFVTATAFGENLGGYAPTWERTAFHIGMLFPEFKSRMLPYLGTNCLFERGKQQSPISLIREWVRVFPEDRHLLYPLYGDVWDQNIPSSGIPFSTGEFTRILKHTARSVKYRALWDSTSPQDRPSLTPYKTLNAMQAFYWALQYGPNSPTRNSPEEVERMRQIIIHHDPEWMDLNRSVWESQFK